MVPTNAGHCRIRSQNSSVHSLLWVSALNSNWLCMATSCTISSTHTAECTPPPSPAGAQGAPGENGEEVVNNPMVNNPEIDIVEVYDLTEDEPQAEDPP